MRLLGFFFASIFPMLAFTAPAQAAPVCGNGAVESEEECDDGNTDPGDCCSPTCQYESTATVCRAAAGVCDAPDNCDGAGSCTPDAKLTSECRAAVDVCDIGELCDGVSDGCPEDLFLPDGTICRYSTHICDRDRYCDGLTPDCRPRIYPNPPVCTPSTGPCDPVEFCEGWVCPPDVLFPAGTVCRAAAGVCDMAEVCDGVTADCPADAYEPDTTVCRADAGDCDVADFCPGYAAGCSSDSSEPEGTSCDDGNSATQNDQCDGSGVCMGTPSAVPAMSPLGRLLVGLFVFASGAVLLAHRRRGER